VRIALKKGVMLMVKTLRQTSLSVHQGACAPGCKPKSLMQADPLAVCPDCNGLGYICEVTWFNGERDIDVFVCVKCKGSGYVSTGS